MSEELWRWSAGNLATAIREKTVKSREIVRQHLDRIAAVNPAVNALTAVLGEEALKAADAADEAIAAGREVGPLHGVPITVKESIDVCGSATTFGLAKYKDAIPERDAPVIRHLKHAGAIIIGRTNMPDFGMRWHTDNDLHGATINPWVANRTPGGSSGGEAVALATGMSPLGIGNDMGGSTRQPAVNCGVAGLRPSTGRVSRVMSAIFDEPPMFYEQVACVNGPMARHVSDLRLALEVMSKADPTDPVWRPAVVPPVPAMQPIRVGVARDPFGDGVAPAVARAMDRAIVVLLEAGYRVEDVKPPLVAEADGVIQHLAETEIAKYLDDILPMISADAGQVLKSVIVDGKPDAARYRDAIAMRHQVAVAWARQLQETPLILGPVSTMEAFEVGYDVGGPEAMRRLIRSFHLTELCNLVGLPSVGLPVLLSDGVPQGVQIIGRRFDEESCLDAAAAIERAASLPTPIDPVCGT